MSDNDKFSGWTEDVEKARLYFYEECKLEKDRSYGFYFEDGTGFCGKVEEFIPYMIRRFKWNPESEFEIDSTLEGDFSSGELYDPSDLEEGDEWDPSKNDDRF